MHPPGPWRSAPRAGPQACTGAPGRACWRRQLICGNRCLSALPPRAHALPACCPPGQRTFLSTVFSGSSCSALSSSFLALAWRMQHGHGGARSHGARVHAACALAACQRCWAGPGISSSSGSGPRSATPAAVEFGQPRCPAHLHAGRQLVPQVLRVRDEHLLHGAALGRLRCGHLKRSCTPTDLGAAACVPGCVAGCCSAPPPCAA